jgi:CubicO group peptidase (beta-lactamase class C family)
MPLVNEPGAKFEYGIGMDWAGILVERITGLSLGDYCQGTSSFEIDSGWDKLMC